jgi:uncharacterized alpha-E superfamily protein
MLSRIADSMYWMARYLERVGETARLLEINLLYLLEAEEDMSEETKWMPLLNISSAASLYAAVHPDGAITTPRILQFVCSGRNNSNSIRNCLRICRENARVARDRISKEMWEAVNEGWLFLEDRLKGSPTPERAGGLLGELRDHVSLINGLATDTMMRGEAYSFFRLGSCVERTDMTARILDVKYHLILPEVSMVGSALDYYQWAALLKSLSGFEAFRRRYHTGFLPLNVVGFVLFEPDFPRSAVFSVRWMRTALNTIGLEGKNGTAAAFASLCDLVDGCSAEAVFSEGLHGYLTGLLDGLARFHSALSEEFFH